ncbi:carcinoembryonic antigen-related cell adhesion molecule 6-like [Anolis sagrei]|uniref:carcinoembryonic antigen-related cell adhesion molecule 6-like n=1 Tax=Anolis sagrei TaxID=38937 RepID=UPI00351F989F
MWPKNFRLVSVSVLSWCFLLTGAQSGTTTTISVRPSKPIEGGDVSLIPASIPASTVSCRWFRGGDALANTILVYYISSPPTQRPGANYTGRETIDSNCSLHITNLAGNYSGTYLFLLDSTVETLKGEVELLVSEPVSGVSITSTPSEILEGDVTTLTCSAAKGSEVSFFWFKGDRILESDDRVSLSNDSRVLTFNTTLRQDLGVYTCLVNNSLSSSKDSQTLEVFYGPDDIHLNSHLVEVTMGLCSHLNLSCIANSNPPAQFQWFFNYTDMNVTESTYSIGPVTWEDAGNYTCQASNKRTNKTGSATITIKLQKDLLERLGLGPGAIAGIVIVSLALGLGLVGGLLYFFLRIRPQRKKPTSDPIQSGPPAYENVSRPGQRNIGENLGSPSDSSSHTYESLQKRTLDVYEEIKHLK